MSDESTIIECRDCGVAAAVNNYRPEDPNTCSTCGEPMTVEAA